MINLTSNLFLEVCFQKGILHILRLYLSNNIQNYILKLIISLKASKIKQDLY